MVGGFFWYQQLTLGDKCFLPRFLAKNLFLTAMASSQARILMVL